MKRIAIPKVDISLSENPFNDDFYGYLFAFCAKNFRQATSFDSCREDLVNRLVDFYMGVPYGSKHIDKYRTLLLVGKKIDWHDLKDGKEEFRKSILRGLKLVHHFEKIAKWPLCRLYQTEISGRKLYLFIGDRRWQRSPYTLSLFALLIRLGRMKEFGEFRTHSDFVKICSRLSRKRCSLSWSLRNVRHDLHFITPTLYLKLRSLMRHFDKIFGKKSAKYYFKKCLDKDEYYDGVGITDFCHGLGEDKRTIAKFMDICERYAS